MTEDLSPRRLAGLMEPYRHHVIVCTGGFCSPDHRGRQLYALLPRLLQREGLLFGPGRVKRGETPCLGICAGGPIVVVYEPGHVPTGTSPGAISATPPSGWISPTHLLASDPEYSPYRRPSVHAPSGKLQKPLASH